ncbi:hypothetical protein ACHWQZ_G017919 [Mnemiopsis leidyi]
MLLAVLLAFLCGTASSFYIPLIAPVEYSRGQSIEIKSTQVESVHTELPFSYRKLPYCLPAKEVNYAENLGEVLHGSRIVNTAYSVNVMQTTPCTKVCEIDLPANDVNKLIDLIEKDYDVHLILDNLPVARKYSSPDGKIELYHRGHKVGQVYQNNVYLYNNFHFKIKYHVGSITGKFRITGFEVESNSHAGTDSCTKDGNPLQLIKDQATKVSFSYSVEWEEGTIAWASRWDTYLTSATNSQIHWFSIINSLIIVLFLSGLLAMIMVRALRRDIAAYNLDEEMDDTYEETGWKLLHGDVMRPPNYCANLVALIGSGVQIGATALACIVLSVLGMLSPASRGSLIGAAVSLFFFFGIIGGYYSGRLYRTFKGMAWKRTAFLTSTLYPGLISSACFILNFLLWHAGSSGAVPFSYMCALLAFWVCVSLPLVFIGFFFGFRKQPYEYSVRTNKIPRPIPSQLWYMRTMPSMLLAGILPFGAVFIELYFIFSAIWENQIYTLFSFLFLVYVILVICCAEIAVVIVYFQLCTENYRWWWKSFFCAAGTGLYVFAYGIFFYYTKLEIVGFTSTVLYLGYTALMSITFGIFTGAVGFFASFMFVRYVYSAVKID